MFSSAFKLQPGHQEYTCVFKSIRSELFSLHYYILSYSFLSKFTHIIS